MVINKLEATFGKLDGDKLELHEGLNIIAAPNESGKSTWCAFIRAMLYGVDSSERQKAGYLPDKLRYAPWSGAAMRGSMELSCGEREITLIRTTKAANAPMREFSAVYTGTNEPVEGLTGASAGQVLTGVEREVFRRSAFIEQGKLAVTPSAELEKRIGAIVSTGEEDCSYTEADTRLRQWQRSRRFNQRGRLPEIEDEINRKNRVLTEQGSTAAKRDKMHRELENAKKECVRLEEEMTESRKTVRKGVLNGLMNVRGEVSAASEKHERAQKRLAECQAAFNASVLGGEDCKNPEAQLRADMGQALELKERASKSVSPAAALAVAALAVIFAVLGIIFSEYAVYAFCAAGLALVVGALLFVSLSKIKASIYEAAKQRKKLLQKYHAEDESGMAACLDEYIRLRDELQSARELERRAADELAAMRRKQEQAESRSISELDFAGGDSHAARLGRELAEAKSKCAELSSAIAEQNGFLAAMGDPMVLASEISRLQDEHEALSNEYDAISLAVQTLKAADADIQSRFSPELGKLAAQYMSRMTDGKYAAVTLGRDFSAAVRENGDSVPRPAEYLSAGTLDLMYLAVRLAVCRLALPEGSSCPLVLDDALVNLDPERKKQALSLLEDISRERQVILFTCE